MERSSRIKARAVTILVYRPRRIPVQHDRRVFSRSVFEVGIGEGQGVAHGRVDGEPEEVADPADVSAGGVDLLEDAVFSPSEPECIEMAGAP